MSTFDPSISDRRTALIGAARRLTAEAGPEAGALIDPDLASELANGLAADIATAIDRRTAAATTLDELVEGLVDGVLEAGAAWREGLQLANVAIERVADFAHWTEMLAPWFDAIERAIISGQARGVVRQDIDPRATALVLRDPLDRAAKFEIRFQRDGYRGATAAIVRGALAPDGTARPTG